jgi:hypothetical protein
MERQYKPVEFQAQDGTTIRPGDLVVIEQASGGRTVGIYRGVLPIGFTDSYWFEFPIHNGDILHTRMANVLKKLESAMDLVPDSVRGYIPK